MAGIDDGASHLIFFARGGGYSRPALEYAISHRIDLFLFDESLMMFIGITHRAKQLATGEAKLTVY